MNPSRLDVLLAMDHELFLQGLMALLKAQPEVADVAAVRTLAELPVALAARRPDVVLLDPSLEHRAMAQVRGLSAVTRVVVLTASDHSDDGLRAMREGAAGVVPRSAALDALMAAIRSVAAGYVWLPPAVQTRMAHESETSGKRRLTRRETEIARLVALGLRNVEAARRLLISEQTVKTHVTRILRKVGVRGRAELALHAVRVGLVDMHERP
jgi:DNA-binding NarL/FixJ family response regulator